MNNKTLFEAYLLYTALTNRPSLQKLVSNLLPEDFSYFKKEAEAMWKLASEDNEVNPASMRLFTDNVGEIVEVALSAGDMTPTWVLSPNDEAVTDGIRLFKEVRLREDLLRQNAMGVDIGEVVTRLADIQSKGQARMLTASDMRELASSAQEALGSGLSYGITLLDSVTGGIGNSQYVIVAARPSIGKSTLLQHIALHNARKGKNVLFVSAEMGEEMVMKRLLSTFAGRSVFSDIDEYARYSAQIPDGFNTLIAGSVQAIERQIQANNGQISLVCVDYLGLIQPKVKSRDIYERVTRVSSELKTLGTQYNIPMVVACQYSRSADGVQPMLSHLRDSGAIEQDADVVISMWRKQQEEDDLIRMDETLKTIRIDVLKNRNGRTVHNGEDQDFKVTMKADAFTYVDV